MSGPNSQRAFIGLGGNLGDPAAAMKAALRALDSLDEIRVVAVSGLYRTPAWGVTDQPDFLNAAAAVETTLTPRGLLERCLEIEASLKRIRTERWGPRVIDLDILVFGSVALDEPGLTIPHPHLQERAFVLLPLADLAPDLAVEGRIVSELASNIDRTGITRVDGNGDWWSLPS